MRLCWIAFAAFAILAGTDARPATAAEPEIHYAPVENLEHVDLALIRSAKKSVDIAMYTLTDWAIIAALKDAHAYAASLFALHSIQVCAKHRFIHFRSEHPFGFF
jgi:phosphatidylserine/phosphatidylglycerophosphate/cardiolipin synthase-like enzyme